ncbi:MAG: hypothetical protein IPK13_24355 [Deltaproteobacteria bacterium]|nr:hypothetical protein [Deltaproteobacteria bacterium]
MAELWNPLDAIPKPNAIVGIDASATMGISVGCDSCHSPGDPATRLELVKGSVLATLPLFQDYFLFGGFTYDGCDYAKIGGRAVPPSPDDPDASLAAVTGLVSGTTHCMRRERYFGASMTEPVSTGRATADGLGDVAILERLLQGELDGFDPMAPWRIQACGSVGLGDPCASWPPKPPMIDPPDPPPAMCSCADTDCHVADGAGGWTVRGGCSPGCDPDFVPLGCNCNGTGCCVYTSCASDGFCYVTLSDAETMAPCDVQPPPNPPYDPYPCWGVEGMPASWSDINTCILTNPDYPYYRNAPACSEDRTGGPSDWCVNNTIQCAGGGSFSAQAALEAAMALYQFPRWYKRTITPELVEDEFCRPLRDAVRTVKAGMLACGGGPLVIYPNPDAPDFCDATRIAASVCTSGPLEDSCVCDDSDAGCSTLQPANSDCGTPLDFKARQQVAVCETYHPSYLRTYYLNQADNRVVGGCRENMAMLFTDGYMGQTAAVAVEAAQARTYYQSVDDDSNMFVFRVSNVFASDADALSSALGQGSAFDATDTAGIQGSMSRVLNRAYRGVYAATSPSLSTFGSYAAIHSFTVPGGGGMPPGDDYLGFPARISWHRIDHGGVVVPEPLFETDWASKVDGAGSCGPTVLGGSDVAVLGPGGSFRNGVARWVNVPANSVDRDGNGEPDDTHPALKWGNFFSNGSTRPVVVEGPRDGLHASYADFDTVAGRPRAIYVMSNGYVLGFQAGTRNDVVSTYGAQNVSYGYTVDGDSGREILRYRPNWLQDPRVTYRYDLNDLVQQPIMTGELVAAEVVFNEGEATAEARTVLVGAQGKTGPGMFALDITNPCNITTMGEWVLPGSTDNTSASPTLGTVLYGGHRTPAVVTTGGLGGSATLYAFSIQGGTLLWSRPLPPGSYPTAPACVDASGEGRLTHCYVLSEAGALLRVKIGSAGFEAPDDITPPGIVGGGRRFGVEPIAFFGSNGEVQLVFGSGNFEDFDKPDAANFFFKVSDDKSREVGMPSGPANLSTSCKTLGSGKIALSPGSRVITRPIVSNEVVAWTVLEPAATECSGGHTWLYAMDFETCEDALTDTPGAAPAPRLVGEGFPGTPVLHTSSKSLIVGTSAAPTAAQTTAVGVRMTSSRPLVKKLFSRPWVDAR